MKITSNIFSFVHPDSLSIDMITITYNPTKAEQEYILKAIKNHGWLETWADKKNNSKDPCKARIIPSKQYHHHIDLLIPDEHFVDDNRIRLELKARKKGVGFLRIEYNPSKVPYEVLCLCLESIMPNGVEHIFEHGRVNRIDIAMDIKDVKPYQLIVDYVKSRYRLCYVESGRPNSIYIGRDNGENQVYLYDKGKELMEHKVKPLSDYQYPDHDLTRLELRHRPKAKKTMLDLLSMQNLLFERLYIIGTPKEVKKDMDFNVKRDLCVLKGFRQVIEQLNKSGDASAFVAKIEKYCVIDFLDLHKLWSTLPASLKHVYPYVNTFVTSTSKV